ncbi:hypothetical protein [Pseudomonas aeruginosa]|uniref:hypothetical protein n=1 Tax=Pseudomonas aeruginosa TaxID=287 RepID=UPI000F822E50|nr:hypothetical protein [Pseudomonas aeruginosa]MBF8385680.1 hypothetical protein [Pseudomonas aeruginosa]MBH8330835.1 hypothetical protein [Pseudomonas aeruginosa]MBH8430584.1 hypothetical protein [Pseudomonas aeruginosa]MCK1104480.1 hypothetical protein [Pseudomonas aeruginosa]MCK1177737.1 hypothetical protein [Pseudomonas aeruginosa]
MPVLYRGFSTVLDAPSQKNIFYHRGRTPVDTDIKIHEAADRWFFGKFGIYARSSSLICSTDYSQANSFGRITYRVVPPVSSPIIYSDSVRDFLEHKVELDSFNEESITHWLESRNFKMVHDASDIDSNFLGEVMVFCESYQVFCLHR